MAARATITKVKKLLAAIVISTIAFFELCFTGKAVGTWRIARADGWSNILTAGEKPTSAVHPPAVQSLSRGAGEYNSPFPPEPAPIFLSRLIIVIVIAGLMIVGALLSVESPNGQSFYTEGGIQRIDENQMASGTGTEPRSSGPGRAEQIAITGCVIASMIMVIGVCLVNAKRKDFDYGKEGKGNRGQD